MKTVRTVAEVRAALTEPRRAGGSIGLVPTMGALHEGHLSLIRRARSECAVVVMSLFVNPTQFNEATDLAAYPRDEHRDAGLAAAAGVDYLFAPGPDEVYPPGYATTVSVAHLTEPLEGTHRGRAHFDGVTTVVTKLFNIVSPDIAYFGQKDAQQAIVIRRLVADLNMAVRIEICPTVREADGLALSSRNVLLSAADRARAVSLHRTLRAVQHAVARGERDPSAAKARGLAELIAADIEPDYLELVGIETLAPVDRIDGDVLAVVAAHVGPARLIDNEIIRVVPPAGAAHGNESSENGRP